MSWFEEEVNEMNPNDKEPLSRYITVKSGDLRQAYIGRKIKATVEVVSDIPGQIEIYLQKVSHSDVDTIITVSASPDSGTSSFAVIPGTLVFVFGE